MNFISMKRIRFLYNNVEERKKRKKQNSYIAHEKIQMNIYIGILLCYYYY